MKHFQQTLFVYILLYIASSLSVPIYSHVRVLTCCDVQVALHARRVKVCGCAVISCLTEQLAYGVGGASGYEKAAQSVTAGRLREPDVRARGDFGNTHNQYQPIRR